MEEKDISIREFQEIVDRWITTTGVRYFSQLTNMALLAEEMGEIARIMAREHGDQSWREGKSGNLADELADLIWVAVAIANQEGIDLTDAIRKNLEKKNIRDATRHRDNPKLKPRN